MNKKYKSKVSYGMLLALFLLFLTSVLYAVKSNGINTAFLVLLGILGVTYAFVLHIFLNTKYSIHDNKLRIKSGFIFNKTIDILTIKTIRKSNSLLASPAPSFDRIAITFGKFDEILISPKDKVSLIADLMQVNPQIKNETLKNKSL